MLILQKNANHVIVIVQLVQGPLIKVANLVLKIMYLIVQALLV